MTVFKAVRIIDDNGVAQGTKFIDGKPRVDAMDYLLDIGEGNVPDHFPFRRSGHNSSVGTAREMIGHLGTYAQLSAAETLLLSSTQGADSAGSAGIGGVFVSGLNGNFSAQQESVALQGTTTVSTANKYRRIFTARASTVGSAGANVGRINVRGSATSSIIETVLSGDGVNLMAAWTVPNGYVAHVVQWEGSEVGKKAVEITVATQRGGFSRITERVEIIDASQFSTRLAIPFVASGTPAGDDIFITAQASAAGGNVAGGFEGWFELK